MGYTLYLHTFPNGKRYVGVTINEAHKRWGGGTNYKKQVVGKAINKYKWKNIVHEILLTGLTREEAAEREIFFIALFRSDDERFGYNIEPGGFRNKEVADSTREKLRVSHLGQPAWNKGMKTPEDVRQRQREAAINRYSREGEFEKMSEIRRNNAPRVKNVEDGIIFRSTADASDVYGISRKCINNCLRGRCKTSGGYHWAYADGEAS